MDRDEVWRFLEQFTEMAAGATTVGLLAVADRSGLLGRMMGADAATTAAIASAAGLQPRYVEEILSGLAAAGVVEYDADANTFCLSDEAAACVADESSPYFMGGWLDMIPALLAVVSQVAVATQAGGGVDFSDFGDDMVVGIDRANGPSMRILLTRKWLPVMPDVVARLQSGARIADVGCGSGAASLAMAGAYPRSTVTGYDSDARSILRAAARAEKTGLENLSFENLIAVDLPLEPPFDLITTFDVVHDLADPLAVLQRIRGALTPGGTYLMMEPDAAPDLADNLSPRGALLYGISTLHCMTQSLAAGGAGLGAAWGPVRAEELCREAGFSRFQRLDIDNQFSAFYRVEA